MTEKQFQQMKEKVDEHEECFKEAIKIVKAQHSINEEQQSTNKFYGTMLIMQFIAIILLTIIK